MSQYDLPGLGQLLVLRLRKARPPRVLFPFFVIASTWWFQESLLLMLTPRCFAVLCMHSPRLVALCLARLEYASPWS